ncbi:Uncharacterized NAD(P)/FAD-binding protein YdhS [Loktanella fryxellensis]|uniref:Uncharacterized NAD(P)/FAD-binding protein YdhS n=1 Tax=Loktanella fryxellensis TaxID=245187 RepID=A0A1H8JZY1_9RHOB|nr:FAD/NAD(P)-binding protein [Loktanella fryxellensis]SEN86324.1 Uncharacterized NAD(P)/FAD-binding protein YdhS [Loktanella fryxellensis]
MALNIAIVGGGPTGVYALHALVAAAEPCFITLFERSGMAGVGMPYSPQFATINMLANIGSIEIPPLTETYQAWLQRQPASFLAPYGVDGTAISDRGFYPRILLGMFFRDQLELLVIHGRQHGHRIAIREQQNVVDLAADDHGVRLTIAGREGETQLSFDRAIIASGHDWGSANLPNGVVLPNPWTGLIDAPQIGPRIAILGTSLSGIDAVVAVAGRIGTFDRTAEGLVFTRHDADDRTHVTMASRTGLLPETDFYCPLPYEACAVFTPAAVAACVSQGQDGLLDRLFALFMAEIDVADPAFAAHLREVDANADTVFGAMFARRQASDPFAWARADLAQSVANASARHTIPWRYAVLRMHEAFSDHYAEMSRDDRRRFDGSLRKVFVDNYAAVPPLSMERLIALADAGLLSIEALGADYAIAARADVPGFTIAVGQDTLACDTLIDARGQRSLTVGSLPFPTLRAQIGEGENALESVLTDSFGLDLSPGEPPAIYLAAISFLMAQHPFIQGLPGSHEIAVAVCADLLGSTVEEEALRTA